MSHSAKILADSISPDGVRLTSFELTYPRIIHAEMCRHRMHSRCVSSSRAIPIQRFITQVENDPYIPRHSRRVGVTTPAEEHSHEEVEGHHQLLTG
jgi:hypothetical protein